MNFRDRIGIDLGRKIRLEEGIEWAGKHGVRYIDVQLDTAANALPTFDDVRSREVRALADRHGVKIGLHTSSAVNVAEYSPYVGDAVDAYLRSYVDAYNKLGASWIVVHAGYHFTKDKPLRMESGLARL
ncbi:MAG TPA: TIM barrel protein, partial [Burkholderiales bacterium]